MLRSGNDSFLKGQGQRSRSRPSKRSNSLRLIGYNFASNCHRDFKLGSYFSL